MNDKKKCTYYLDENLVKEFRKTCLDLDLKFSGILEEAIKQWLERKKNDRT